MAITQSKGVLNKVKFALIGALIGIILGVIGTVFVLNFNPPDEENHVTPSVVFDRIVKKSELVSSSQTYNITDKASSVNTFFDLFDLPFTQNSFWYRYVGTIKAGVNLEDAEYAQDGDNVTITLAQPYIISNTPDMEKSGVLEENNNILNPIAVADVDAFQRLCVQQSEEQVVDGGLLEEARTNAEDDIRDMFNAALGSEYNVEFVWRDSE